MKLAFLGATRELTDLGTPKNSCWLRWDDVPSGSQCEPWLNAGWI